MLVTYSEEWSDVITDSNIKERVRAKGSKKGVDGWTSEQSKYPMRMCVTHFHLHRLNLELVI